MSTSLDAQIANKQHYYSLIMQVGALINAVAVVHSQMQPVVRVVSVTNVACATTQTAAFALEIDNAFLLHLKRDKEKHELDKQRHMIKLNISSVRL